jgi:hypothetical protein
MPWSGWNGQLGRCQRQLAAVRREYYEVRRAWNVRWQAGRPPERASGPFHPNQTGRFRRNPQPRFFWKLFLRIGLYCNDRSNSLMRRCRGEFAGVRSFTN